MSESDIDKTITEREVEILVAGLEERVNRPGYPERSIASLLLFLINGKALEPHGAELVLNSVDELDTACTTCTSIHQKYHLDESGALVR